MTNPLVSIVIPVFNGDPYLRDAIESALSQTYHNVEVVVINDGSRDGGATERIAVSFGDRLRYFEKPNGGVASALNRGIKEMRGDYFSWLSHDDIYTNDKIERQMEWLSGRNGEQHIVYSNCCSFSDSPDDCDAMRVTALGKMPVRYWLTAENALHGCTLLIPRRAFDECGLFDERLRTTQDYDLWFRMAARYQFHGLEDYLVKARHHPGQGTRTMKAIALVECNELLAGFVRAMSESELLRGAGVRSLCLAYASLSENLMRRGFFASGQAAAGCCIRALNTGNFSERFAAISSLVRTHLFMHPLNQLRRAVGRAIHANGR